MRQCVASRSSLFTFGERSYGVHWTEVCVGARTSQATEVKKKYIPPPVKTGTPAIQSVPRNFFKLSLFVV
jgi:hypothetical protein